MGDAGKEGGFVWRVWKGLGEERKDSRVCGGRTGLVELGKGALY